MENIKFSKLLNSRESHFLIKMRYLSSCPVGFFSWDNTAVIFREKYTILRKKNQNWFPHWTRRIRSSKHTEVFLLSRTPSFSERVPPPPLCRSDRFPQPSSGRLHVWSHQRSWIPRRHHRRAAHQNRDRESANRFLKVGVRQKYWPMMLKDLVLLRDFCMRLSAVSRLRLWSLDAEHRPTLALCPYCVMHFPLGHGPEVKSRWHPADSQRLWKLPLPHSETQTPSDASMIRWVVSFMESVCRPSPGAVRAPGPVPLPRLAVVSEGQEREGGRLLVRPGHHTPVQQAGQRGVGVLPLVHQPAQPAASPAAGEVDQRGRGQCARVEGRAGIRKNMLRYSRTGNQGITQTSHTGKM